MGAFASLSDLVNRATGGNDGAPETRWKFIDGRVGAAVAATPTTGRWTSLWQYNGQPSHGDVPTTASSPTNATAGSLKQTDPGGGRQKWLLGGSFAASHPGTLLVYDRLAHMGGLSGTVTTAQTVNATAARYTGAEAAGNEIWVEVYTQIGASATTITASYTNQAGTAAKVTLATAIGASGLNQAQRWLQLPLASGDTGVRSVETVTLAGTTGTAGNFGVTIVRPLLQVALPTLGLAAVRSLLTEVQGFAEIKVGACIAFAWLATGTTTPYLMYHSLTMVEA